MSFFDLPPLIEKMLASGENISDLNFSVGRPPQVEINGKLTPVEIKGLRSLTPYQTEVISMALMGGNTDAAEKLVKTGSVDVSFSIHQRTRFRVNIFSQRGTYSIVMRVIPTTIPTIESLSLPPQLGDISQYKNDVIDTESLQLALKRKKWRNRRARKRQKLVRRQQQIRENSKYRGQFLHSRQTKRICASAGTKRATACLY